ncbi:origin of replication complex subunit 3 isoform X2 [Ananas comosus]|uniref:Origin of replication complex subunit 3 isoform X2 n=1 Tax=Ananas comosus TaxID=4615 RepID=A0A6P5FD68_ANACO|nr:origin of replication complex subunit 3 isoform X2 [Ananas comosus]
MATSPTASDPPSSPIAASDTADNNLQPFFVLHKALPGKSEKRASGSGRTRRKIDLSASSPKSAEKSDQIPPDDSDAICEKLRLEAFERTWSKIDSTIKEVLRQINLNLFNEVLQWIQELFSIIKSSRTTSLSEIQRPYPLLTDALCRRVPAAFVFTKNVEFVDDLLTFQDLGVHLKSNRCHVASLSGLDFLAKHGIGGCVRSLLRQLVSDASDVADFAVLASWYCEQENYNNPIIIIIDDMQRCNGGVLGEFITLLSEWVIKIPIFIIMGVATTVDAPRKLLSSNALQHLQPCKLTLGSPAERMNALVEAILVKPCSGFSISHKVAVFLRNYFLRHDGTITSFISALKLACSKHFSLEPLSCLCLGTFDENRRDEFDAFPGPILRTAFDLPSCKREKISQGSGTSITQGLSQLRKLQRSWSSVVMCLFETGKRSKMQLLDIFCEASDPNLQISSMTRGIPITGKLGSGKAGFIAQAIHRVRELPIALLPHVLKMWSLHMKDMNEVIDKVKELQSNIASGDGGQLYKEKWTDIHKRPVYLGARKGTVSVNDKAAMLLDDMVRKYLTPIECAPFHEIICFGHVEILQSALIGDTRRIIQVDLLKPQNHLRCSCCNGDENIVSPTMHDTSIISRFCRAVTELQITGLLRMPSKRRPDFVQRVAFGL